MRLVPHARARRGEGVRPHLEHPPERLVRLAVPLELEAEPAVEKEDGSEKARGRVWRLAVLADQRSRGLEVHRGARLDAGGRDEERRLNPPPPRRLPRRAAP